LLDSAPAVSLRGFGSTLSTYGAFALAGVAVSAAAISNDAHAAFTGPPTWASGCGIIGTMLAFALELAAMLCLVVSGMLDGARPRVVAGWLGLAAVIASITWAVKGSLLRRSMFLATAGAVAIVLAFSLGRLFPRADRP
jgi:hypothetical protein